MKNLFIVFLALLILSSCKDKDKPAIPVTKITLEPNPATVAMGAKLKLTPVLTPNEASNKTLTWESSAPTIATVDSNGEITGVAAGTATITATAADGSKVTGTTALTVKSNISDITLGDEKFHLTIPADGSTTITLNNAPRTLSSILNAVPVNITADGATIKIGSEDFKQGQHVDFTNSKIFTVSTQNGATTKYTIAIIAYNATTNPYGIYTVAHLNDVRNDKAGSYKLMNNVDLPAREDAGAAAATGIKDYGDKGWLPIAHEGRLTAEIVSEKLKVTVTDGFTGTFDGGNFSINNLCINRTILYAGLFGVTSGATLKNLGLTGTASPVVSSSSYTGALAGFIFRGSATNCYTSVNFSISYTIANSAEDCHLGGIAGLLFEATLSKCYSTGDVSAIARGVNIETISGGLVGSSALSTISNCYATGNVSASATTFAYAGGLVGLSEFGSTISNGYATGNVSSTYPSSPNYTSYAGGLVAKTDKGTISNCYRNSEAQIKKNNAPAASADASITGIAGKSKKDMQTDAFTTSLNNGASAWGRSTGKNDDLPYIIGVGVGKN